MIHQLGGCSVPSNPAFPASFWWRRAKDALKFAAFTALPLLARVGWIEQHRHTCHVIMVRTRRTGECTAVPLRSIVYVTIKNIIKSHLAKLWWLASRWNTFSNRKNRELLGEKVGKAFASGANTHAYHIFPPDRKRIRRPGGRKTEKVLVFSPALQFLLFFLINRERIEEEKSKKTRTPLIRPKPEHTLGAGGSNALQDGTANKRKRECCAPRAHLHRFMMFTNHFTCLRICLRACSFALAGGVKTAP